uniref:Uncharacterized protein n=1 Tax=Sus scrofa TaxID=9823 RepID=A0A8D1R1W2_PIG
MVPAPPLAEDEERLLPLAQRWPRASKFLLSGCAATVAELGTRPGPPARVSRGVAQGWGAGRAAACLCFPCMGFAVRFKITFSFSCPFKKQKAIAWMC